MLWEIWSNPTCCFFNVLFGDLNPQKSFLIQCWRLFSVWPLWRSQFPIHTSLQEQAFHQHLNDSLWRTKAHPLQSVKKNVKVVEIQHHKFVFLQNYGHKTLFWQIWHEDMKSFKVNVYFYDFLQCFNASFKNNKMKWITYLCFLCLHFISTRICTLVLSIP